MSPSVEAANRSADGFGLRLALFYAALLVVTGIQVPFFPLWLGTHGLDSQSIGVILAAPVVVRIAAVPIINRLADRWGDTRTALIVGSLASTLCFAIVGFAKDFTGILLTIALAAIFFTPIGALTDAYALKGLHLRKRAYGPVRLWGSVAFLAANLCAGLLLTAISVGSLIWVIVAALAAMALQSFLLLPVRITHAENPGADDSAFRHLWRSPKFLMVAAAASLIQSSHAIYYGFSALDWTGKGLSSGVVGMLWAVGVAAEIVLFAISGRFAPRPLVLIGLGAAGALVRWIGMSLDPPAMMLAALQCLHALSFGATHLGSVQFAAQLAHARQSATAQGDFGTVLAIGGATATGFSGVLYGNLGDDAYLVMAAMVGLGGCLLVIAGQLRR